MRKRVGRVGGPVAVLAVALALACAGCGVGATASAERDEGEEAQTGAKVPCREALRFADQERLPAGAEDAACEMQRGIDTLYDIRFRISGTGLDTWLDDSYPDMELRSDCVQDDVDRCGLLTLDPYAEGGAVAVELTVRDESGGHALVHYRPFNT
ncbi:hypothetical protein AB0D14_21760 [Streptomyces sp. NPDC048484]|uniref:hypothetical protein n=1 Tax=Streptomyces sp. NPDC048484 TaxID=3155146 RepID=UPI00341A2538